jgi:peroxiredoxin Q/BCP
MIVSPVEQKQLNVGDSAPGFTLRSIGLKEISLADYRGRNVVLLFYPLDWTPG